MHSALDCLAAYQTKQAQVPPFCTSSLCYYPPTYAMPAPYATDTRCPVLSVRMGLPGDACGAEGCYGYQPTRSLRDVRY
eukprot:3934985-Rhodomonas_salina.1